MKPPRSAGVGQVDTMSGRYDNQKEARGFKRFWEKKNPLIHYELVKITTEPVVETKKRKSK